MRRVLHLLCAALTSACCGHAQTVLLDSFDAGSPRGRVVAGTSWVGNVTQNTSSITVGGTALSENGWGASGLSINGNGTSFLTINARRNTGHTASVLVIQLEDSALNTQLFYVSASAFAVGSNTQVQVPITAWTGGFSPTQITGWSIGGGGVGGAAFRMNLVNMALATTATAGATYAPDRTTTLTSPLPSTGGLTLNGAGTLVLGAANTFSGAVTLQQGTLRLGAAGALPAGAPASIAAGSTLDLNGVGATVGALEGAGAVTLGSATLGIAPATPATFSGAIAGTGSLVKSGAGRLTLSGTNLYTGTTRIVSGELKLAGSAAHSAFTVSGGTLSGSGRVGALTVASTGTLSPGSSPGTLFVDGAATFEGGGNYIWEINRVAGAAGTSYDLLSISGALAITATNANKFALQLTSLALDNSAGPVSDFNPDTNYSFTFVTASGGITGFSADKFALNTQGTFANPFTGTWSVSESGNSLLLNYTRASAIPEPSTYAALLGGLALCFVIFVRRAAPRPHS